MELINLKVKHKVFGEGVIIANESSYVTVRFQKDEKKFMYPNAFDLYLTVENSEISENIKQEIEIMKRLEEEKKEQFIKLEQQRQIKKNNSEKGKKIKTKIYPRANIAFKCNFCDGGHSEKQVGFNGVCSDNIIRNNIELEKRTWCNSEDCACGLYLKGEITRFELEDVCNNGGFVCYESQMLRDWKALAGIVQTGKKKGQPMKLNGVQNNSLCVLTTRDPNAREHDRYIFGIFLVDETYEGNNQDEGYVTTKSKYRIKLSPKEAHKMLFWNYHANDNQPEVPAWSSGLHRYFEDEQAVQILQDIAKLKQGTREEELANEFLLYFARINDVDISTVPEKCGALKKRDFS